MKITFTFDQNDYAFVRDHCPENQPVVPFVSAVDVFYTVLQEHVGPCVLEDVRLVKGIILSDFKTFEMMVEIDEDKKTIQLIGENGVVHYRAAYEKNSVIPEVRTAGCLGPQTTSHAEKNKVTCSIDLSSPVKRQEVPDSLLAQPSGMTNIITGDYEFLFHGPMLHSIVSIQTNAPDKEATGILKTATGMNWSKTDWFFDPFACDGALQMGCQLAFMAKQKASLPSKIRQAIFYQKPTESAVHVHLVFQKMSGLQYIFDAHLFDKEGMPICSLKGVESYFRLFKTEKS